MPEMEVHVVSCTQKPMKSPAKLGVNLWFHSLHVPKAGWLRTGYQGCIRAVRKALSDIRPDIVHGQGTERDCAISAVFSGFPNVLTIHGNMRLIAEVNKARPFSFLWLAARLEKVVIPRSDGVVCITSYTKQAMEKLARRTWVVPNAVHPSFFDVLPAPTDRQIILCVGNIGLRKNQNAFIRALDSLPDRDKPKVTFLGAASKEDPYAREFFELIQSRPWCEFGGFADRETLKQHLRSATLLALPSLEDNCPMVVLEAMAASVPVLAAKVGGLPDLIEEGKNGYFCDPLSSRSLLDGVTRMLKNPSESAATAIKAKEIAREKYHPSAIARKHLKVYQEVICATRGN